MAAKKGPKVINSSGKRKTAIARATIKEGNGLIRINAEKLDIYQPEVAKLRIQQSIALAEDFVDLAKLNIAVSVNGGGVMGQADAVSSAIARGLLAWSDSDELLERYHDYDRTIVAGDYRQTEVHKPGQSSKGPRHKRQKSYR